MILRWDDLSDQFVLIRGEQFGMQRRSWGRIIASRSQVGNQVSKWAEVETEDVFPDVNELLEGCSTD